MAFRQTPIRHPVAKETRIISCPKCGKEVEITDGDLAREILCVHCRHRFVPASAGASIPLDDTEQQIADLAVRLKLLTPDQPVLAAVFPRSAKDEPGARFIAARLLTKPQIDRLLATLCFKDKRVADSRFGTLAIERGWASPDQVAAALEDQKRAFLRDGSTLLIGRLFVEKGIITQAQCDALLADQGRARTQPREPEADSAGARVMVSDDHMSATLILDNAGAPPSLDQLHQRLAQHRIVHGIDTERLQAIAERRFAATEGVIVAKATPPVAPVDGYVEYLFDRNPRKAGHEKSEVQIDFRDRGDIPQVTSGTVLARHVPPVSGQPGVDVFGRSTLSQRAKDTPLRAGKGVALTDDKLTAVATEDGFPSVSPTGVLSVLPEYRIDGDVDFGTGNVNFHGRVVVSGTVRSHFRVRCGELVAREIEAAVIETDGDVTVNGGIIGAQIRCGGTLRAFYLHRTKAQVLGDAVVVRELVDSELEAGGAFVGRQCIAHSSTISAMGPVEIKEIGSETSNPCRIVSGIDEKVQHELAFQHEQLERQRVACSEIDKRITAEKSRRDAILAEIGPLAQQQDRAQVRQRQLQTESGGAAATETAALAAQVRALDEQLNALFTEQDGLEEQLKADEQAHLEAQQTLHAMESELAHLKTWAAERVGSFLVRAELIHQHTILKGPHLEARLDGDRKAARLTERERVGSDGRAVWQFVNV